MPSTQTDPEAWKRMVLRNLPPPAWLAIDAPHCDVVLSSRVRLMRNLRGHRFPHTANRQELLAILAKVLDVAKKTGLDLEILRSISHAERDHLVGCRLVSLEFAWNQDGRALLLDEARSLSVMINEEDHLRLQALTGGWSLDTAEQLAKAHLARLGEALEFAQSPDFGYLAASPYNSGEGRRLSCMLHLIGLAGNRRLPSVLKALTVKGLSARGLFGESSRAVGAFLQVSLVQGDWSEFVGAVEYLIREERLARQALSRDEVKSKADQAAEFAITSRTLGLADSLRVLAWIRWAAAAKIPGYGDARTVDAFLTTLEIRSDESHKNVGRARADALRRLIGG